VRSGHDLNQHTNAAEAIQVLQVALRSAFNKEAELQQKLQRSEDARAQAREKRRQLQLQHEDEVAELQQEAKDARAQAREKRRQLKIQHEEAISSLKAKLESARADNQVKKSKKTKSRASQSNAAVKQEGRLARDEDTPLSQCAATHTQQAGAQTSTGLNAVAAIQELYQWIPNSTFCAFWGFVVVLLCVAGIPMHVMPCCLLLVYCISMVAYVFEP